jgi:hypothetical protein
MVRQNVEGLLGEAFRIIDAKSFAEKKLVEIKPELVFMQAAGASTGVGAASATGVAKRKTRMSV